MEFIEVRLSDGSDWILFKSKDDFLKSKDWQEIKAIEIHDRKEFEFLFWNGIEMKIPDDLIITITINKDAVLFIKETDYSIS